MPPEQHTPSKFGLTNAVPTKEGDVYAFGLVILQVFALFSHHLLVFPEFRQVLTGEQPFRDIKPVELPYHISQGVRPEKPADAEAIGISDSLWELIQKCWDGERKRRPQIQEVVAGVGDAAADWHTDMPPNGTEHLEDSVTKEGPGVPNYGEFSLFHIVLFFSQKPSVQIGFSNLIRATTG